jgi:Zn-dependent alcohol dehydrogenase
MRAAVLETGTTSLVIDHDIELDDPGPGEVKVRVAYCGLCHSDVSAVKGIFPAITPVVLGHEAAGVVTEVGPSVVSLSVGDHVVLSPLATCGHCDYCVRGHPSVCANTVAIAMGMSPDGTTRLRRRGEVVYRGLGLAAMADEVVVGETAAIKVPDDVPLDVACLIGCAVQTGIGSVVNTVAPPPGSTFLVLGAGGIGLSVVAGARLSGATRIIVSDPNPARREMAGRFGATDLIDPGTDDVVSVAHALTGIGVDVALDAVGSAALVETAVAACRSGGTTVMVGAPAPDDRASIGVAETMFTEKRLVGALLGSSRAARDFPRIISWWQSGLLDLDALVTRRRPLAEVNEAIADMVAGDGIRTVLEIAP